MRPKKSLGQNFLMHARTAERIARVAGVTTKDVVLEIGPGTGKLTAPLLALAKKVIAVETDHELVTKLEETFAGEIKKKRLELVAGDIRAFDPSKLKTSYKLVANIPYYITGEIIRTFLTAKKRPTSMTLLVQKEVAERIARSKKESLLSISVKIFGTPKYEFTVPRGAFVPAPNVDSAVLSISNIRSPFRSQKAEIQFFDLVRAGFGQKRKLAAKNLRNVAKKEHIDDAFMALGIPANARAEDISLSAWQALSAALPRT